MITSKLQPSVVLRARVTSEFRGRAQGRAMAVALRDGFVNAFSAGGAIAFAGVLVSIFLVRGRDLRPQETRKCSSLRSKDAA